MSNLFEHNDTELKTSGSKHPLDPLVIRRRAYMKDYYTKNKDEWTKRRNENREKVNKAKREYYRKHRGKILLAEKVKREKYRADNPDKRKKEIRLTDNPNYYKQYRQENKEKIRKLERDYYEKNKDRILNYCRNRYKNNRDEILSKFKNSDSPIRALICGRHGMLRHSEIPQELVEIKKLQLQLKKEIKNVKKNIERPAANIV